MAFYPVRSGLEYRGRDRGPVSTNERGIISIRGVSKHFGAVCAVDDVNLEVQRGEFFSLLGPSGCGKTTLLRMLAGLDTPGEGEIYIDDQPMSAIPAHR